MNFGKICLFKAIFHLVLSKNDRPANEIVDAHCYLWPMNIKNYAENDSGQQVEAALNAIDQIRGLSENEHSQLLGITGIKQFFE